MLVSPGVVKQENVPGCQFGFIMVSCQWLSEAFWRQETALFLGHEPDFSASLGVE